MNNRNAHFPSTSPYSTTHMRDVFRRLHTLMVKGTRAHFVSKEALVGSQEVGGGEFALVVRQALFHLSQERHLRSLATNNRIARSMAMRFVAGETIEDAINAVLRINSHGMSATLDHLGENVTTRAEAVEAADACCRSLDAIHAAGADCNLSVKLTQLGLDIDTRFATDTLERVVAHAAGYDTFVRIDMESSEYVDRTLGIFYELRERRANVGVVIQSYLYRSERDTRRLVDAGARVRLVKGAYLEPEEVAFPRKVDVDAQYVRLMRILLDGGCYPAIATHDPAMIDATRRHAVARGIDRSQFDFQMLYGVRRDLQDYLMREGYRVRVYVPYGTQWYPYFMRRLAERPANVMFVVGNIAREASI